MNFIKPITIKPTNYFNSIYNTYLQNPDNNESNFYILNLLKCHGYFITPILCNIIQYLNFLKQNENSNKYYNNLINTLITSEKKIECSICLDEINKNEFISTKCFHIFCLKCYITYFRNHLCKDKFKNIKCPICSEETEYNNYYLVLNDTKLFKTKKNMYITYFLNKLNTTTKIKDYSFEDSLIYNIGFKGIYLIKKFYKNEYPMNISNNNLKIIISDERSWFYFFNSIIEEDYFLDNSFLFNKEDTYINKINFIDFNKKILILNYEYLIIFINFLLNIKNQYNSKLKINFIFTEPYSYKKKEYLNKILNLLFLTYENKFYSFTFKQLIIKNTIDQKIFKDNAILC